MNKEKAIKCLKLGAIFNNSKSSCSKCVLFNITGRSNDPSFKNLGTCIRTFVYLIECACNDKEKNKIIDEVFKNGKIISCNFQSKCQKVLSLISKKTVLELE